MKCYSSKAKSLILFDRYIHLIYLLIQDLLKTQVQNTKLNTELQGEHRGRTSSEWKRGQCDIIPQTGVKLKKTMEKGCDSRSLPPLGCAGGQKSSRQYHRQHHNTT
jgi:hypothetical protein